MTPELEALEAEFDRLLDKQSVLHWQKAMAEQSLERSKIELGFVARDLNEVSMKIEKLKEPE